MRTLALKDVSAFLYNHVCSFARRLDGMDVSASIAHARCTDDVYLSSLVGTASSVSLSHNHQKVVAVSAFSSVMTIERLAFPCKIFISRRLSRFGDELYTTFFFFLRVGTHVFIFSGVDGGKNGGVFSGLAIA